MAESPLTDRNRATLSVAIIAKDEEDNLRRTLPSVSWADEVVLVDSGSVDKTVALAQSSGAKVFTESWRGFAGQKNFSIDCCRCDWVLSIDADEEVSGELRDEISRLLASAPAFEAYFIPRKNYFLGRWMRRGGLYPDRKLRLFRRGVARFEERPVHETVRYESATGCLRGDLIHRAYPTLSVYLEHMDRYSSASVPILVGKGKTSRGGLAFVWNVFLIPVATFVYNYWIRLGFLDGREGLLFHLYNSVYVSWKYAKAWAANQ
jgi:glycosyltransferase involved in cell wall biosynthesis